MKELVFRMTKTQLDTVASQMAGNGPECVALDYSQANGDRGDKCN